MCNCYVSYSCDECGNHESPMNHANPVARCAGRFFRCDAGWRCDVCGSVYDYSDEHWCTECESWSLSFTVADV